MSKRLETIEKVIAAGSKDPFHHYARAMELRSLERVTDALAAFDQVSSDFPAYVPTYLMAAQIALELAERVGRVIEVGSTSHREDQLHGAGQDPGIVVDVGGLARGEEPDWQRGGAAEVEIAVGKQHSF